MSDLKEWLKTIQESPSYDGVDVGGTYVCERIGDETTMAALDALDEKAARIAELERENQTLKGCLTILDHDARQALESR